MSTLSERVAEAKTLLGVRRETAIAWAKLVERESAAIGEAPLETIRRHHEALDQKIGVVGGLGGFLAAAIALMAPGIEVGKTPWPLVIGFGALVFLTAYAGYYSLSALSTAAGGDLKAEDLEVTRIMRLTRRGTFHAMALRCAQAASIAFAVVLGMQIGFRL